MIKRAKKIERLVEQLLVHCNISSPPIDVFSIARNKDINIIQGDLGDVSGILLREGSLVTIGVNQNHSEARKRFTIAHEIGHFILHGDEALHVDKVFAIKLRNQVSSEAIDLGEIEANKFAAELLMPTNMVHQRIQELPEVLDYEKDAVIRNMAKVFNVSQQAMTIRLVHLGYIKDSI